jgi:hypothetical protein
VQEVPRSEHAGGRDVDDVLNHCNK